MYLPGHDTEVVSQPSPSVSPDFSRNVSPDTSGKGPLADGTGRNVAPPVPERRDLVVSSRSEKGTPDVILRVPVPLPEGFFDDDDPVRSVITAVLGSGLARSVNIVNATTSYMWHGEIRSRAQSILEFEIRTEDLAEVTEIIKASHPDRKPCFTALALLHI